MIMNKIESIRRLCVCLSHLVRVRGALGHHTPRRVNDLVQVHTVPARQPH